jgi:Kef-type K+ transport system membrane component KefB
VAVLLHVLVALAAIILTARLVGLVFRQFGQPAVMGEVVGGILLGPSFLGWIAPGVAATLLPRETMPVLGVIAQLAVILYMFLIGLELDLAALRGSLGTTLTIATASIAVPFVMGVAFAPALFSAFAPAGVAFMPFVLFVGVSMSITAFPVLARILADRGLQKTPLGIVALTCAALNDAMAWVLLAVVVSVTSAPLGWMAILERYAIFIAFTIGAIIPHRGLIATTINRRIPGIVGVLFLPVFFAFTGTRTQIGLMQTLNDWLICGAIILVATAGKLGGATLAARMSGLPWRDSAALGILMNTRGLVELIVLNIGLDLGVLSPRLFTMLVIMALITTFMTSPLLTAVRRE